MSKPGTVLGNEILGEFGAVSYMRVWRNPVATAWVGTLDGRRASDGAVVLKGARPIETGLCEGASDLIGIAPRRFAVCPHCGEKLPPDGRLLAVELKVGRDSLKANQRSFLRVVSSFGALAGVVGSVEEFRDLLRAGDVL